MIHPLLLILGLLAAAPGPSPSPRPIRPPTQESAESSSRAATADETQTETEEAKADATQDRSSPAPAIAAPDESTREEQPAEIADSDEFLYLARFCDVDGFARRDDAAQGARDRAGDLDGEGNALNVALLPSTRTFTVRSARHGDVVFLRPNTDAARKNLVSMRGQTIPVRTARRHNVLLTLGVATREAAHGFVKLRFRDGSTANAPIGLSSYSGPARLGEELAFADASAREAGGAARPRVTARTSGSRSTGPAGATILDGAQIWLQTTPLPPDRVLESITLPRAPDGKILALTLGWRAGVTEFRDPPPGTTSAPEAAPVAIFSADGFPALGVPDDLSPARIAQRLDALGIPSAMLDLDHLRDPEVLRPERYAVLVLAHGDAFPRDALASLSAYRRTGGVSVLTGVPFTRPVEKSSYGTWWLGAATSAYRELGRERSLGLLPVGSWTSTRVWPSEPLATWGLAELPWNRCVHALAGLPGASLLGLDAREERVEIEPLLRIGSWEGSIAAVVRQKSEGFQGTLDVLTPTRPIWIDGQPATDLHVEWIARAVAFGLHESGQLTDERWAEICTPFVLPPRDPPTPSTETASLSLEDVPPRPGVVHVTRVDALRDEERVLLVSAQAIIHRQANDSLFLAESDAELAALRALAEREKLRVVEMRPERALARAHERRCVVVDPALPRSLDLATMVASSESLLIAWPGLIERYGLEPIVDLRGAFATTDDLLRFAATEVRPRLRGTALASLETGPSSWRGRDIVLIEGAYILPLAGADEVSAAFAPASARASALEILLSAPVLTPVFATEAGTRDLVTASACLWRPIDGANTSFLRRISPTRAERPHPRALELANDRLYIAVIDDGRRGNAAAPIPHLARGLRLDAPGLALDPEPALHPGLRLDDSLDPIVWGRRFGAEKRGHLTERLVDGLGKYLQASGRTWIQAPFPAPDDADLDAFSALPGGTVVFVEPRDARDSPVDVPNASHVLGEVTIVHDVGSAALASLLDPDGSAPFRRAFPLVLFARSSDIEAAMSNGPLPTHVEIVSPAELGLIARQLHSKRRSERLAIVDAGSEWRYLDDGSDPGSSWRKPRFDDSAWKTGPAELGFGDANEGRPEATLLSKGDTPGSSHLVYYFRREVELPSTDGLDLILLEVLADDGCTVSIDGEEMMRANIRGEDPIDATTRAGSARGGSAELAWERVALAPDRLREGKRVIAVSVHQSSPSSSDLSFDLRLIGYRFTSAE